MAEGEIGLEVWEHGEQAMKKNDQSNIKAISRLNLVRWVDG